MIHIELNNGNISMSSCFNKKVKTIRDKGHSLLNLLSDYVVVDLETTGLDPDWCEIIEVSALKVRDDKIVDTFDCLVKPNDEIDDFITELTSITNEMLQKASSIEEVLPAFLDFIGDDVILGHNINFDINFIYDNKIKLISSPLKNDYIDTMRIARKVLPELKHHRLIDVANHFNVNFDTHHRSMADCQIAYDCYLCLKSKIIESGTEKTWNNNNLQNVKAKDISATSTDFNEDHPLYGKTCVFTGKLEKMTRAEAMQIFANIGGINADNVTKATNYLILGNNDFCSTIKGGKSSKHKKAEKLALSGQDIRIISENVFYDMLAD